MPTSLRRRHIYFANGAAVAGTMDNRNWRLIFKERRLIIVLRNSTPDTVPSPPAPHAPRIYRGGHGDGLQAVGVSNLLLRSNVTLGSLYRDVAE